MFVDSSDILVDGYVVVVDYDKQVAFADAGIVQPFESQPSRKRSIPYEGYGLCPGPSELCRLRQPECGGYGCGGMSCPEDIISAFLPAREAADAIFHTVFLEKLFPPGKYLVRVCLMSHIEYDIVFRCVIDIVQPDDKLHRPEARSEMSRIPGTAFYHIFPDFGTQGLEFLCVEIPDVGGPVDFVEESVHSISCLEGLSQARDGCGMRPGAEPQ